MFQILKNTIFIKKQQQKTTLRTNNSHITYCVVSNHKITVSKPFDSHHMKRIDTRRVNKRAQVWLHLRPELGAHNSAERRVHFQYAASTDRSSRRKPNSTGSTSCTWLTLLIRISACVEVLSICIYAIAQWRFEQVLLLSRVQVHIYKFIWALWVNLSRLTVCHWLNTLFILLNIMRIWMEMYKYYRDMPWF